MGNERNRLDSGYTLDEDTSDDSQRMRRVGGARHNISERVAFHRAGRTVVEGWALNLSRGGLRAIVEEALAVGDDVEVTIGETELRRPARVVWVRDKQGDGAVVGVTFTGAGGAPPPTPSEDERAARGG
ncbi:MAG: PilZ domain-containing protein [Polyangiaceae bacterium]|nr:PilZ domain-containing protein [Polyangiaceae bacterium]